MGDRFAKMKTLFWCWRLPISPQHVAAALAAARGAASALLKAAALRTPARAHAMDLEDASECPSSELLQQSAFGDTFQEDVLVAESTKVKHHATATQACACCKHYTPDAPDCGALK